MKSIPIVARHNFYGQVWRELECGHWQQEGSGGKTKLERRARCKLCAEKWAYTSLNDLGADLKLFNVNAAAYRTAREMEAEGKLNIAQTASFLVRRFGHGSRAETDADPLLSEFVTRCLKYINWRAPEKSVT